MKRLFIQTQDVEALMSVSAGYARRIIRDIKKSVGKEKAIPLTIREFAEYMRLDYEEALNEINQKDKTKKAS